MGIFRTQKRNTTTKAKRAKPSGLSKRNARKTKTLKTRAKKTTTRTKKTKTRARKTKTLKTRAKRTTTRAKKTKTRAKRTTTRAKKTKTANVGVRKKTQTANVGVRKKKNAMRERFWHKSLHGCVCDAKRLYPRHLRTGGHAEGNFRSTSDIQTSVMQGYPVGTSDYEIMWPSGPYTHLQIEFKMYPSKPRATQVARAIAQSKVGCLCVFVQFKGTPSDMMNTCREWANKYIPAYIRGDFDVLAPYLVCPLRAGLQ